MAFKEALIRLEWTEHARSLEIFQDCARWLQSKGIAQWGHYLTEEALPLMRRRFDEGEVYVLRKDGRDAASVVIQEEDAFWGGRGKDGRALYLHNIAVGRAFAGQNLGGALVEWAAGEARKRGKAKLRLDCFQDNPVLMAFYRGRGFQPSGSVEWQGRTIQLFEREI